MLGFISGFVCGLIQFFLLRRFAHSVTSGGKPAIGLGLLQLLLPAALLMGCAFFMPANLVWAATGIACPLIGGALIYFLVSTKRRDGPPPPPSIEP